MASSILISSAFITILLLTCFISTSISLRIISDHKPNTNPLGFTTRVIHRHSPESPFYDPKLTHFDRTRNAIQRSKDRYNHYTRNRMVPNDMRAPISYRNFEYVISHRIGTPAVDTYSVIDTSSDLTWFQCRPCDNCYDQEIPIFDPRKSISYAKVGCEDARCKEESSGTCDKDGTYCRYNLDYVDIGHSQGILSTETFVFQHDTWSGNISILEMAFGCGHNNTFPYLRHEPENIGAPGIIGLGKQPLSLISQLSFDKFSHCFTPMTWNKTSLLRFGLDAIITDNTTPMLDNGHVTAENYYVRMEGISVGETRLNIPKGIFEISAEGDGGVIIDTGTAYSHLIMMAHDPLIIELEEQIKLEKAPFDPDGSYPLCYKTNNKSDIITSMPYITFHFSGMDLILQKWNTWEDDGDGSVCLTLIQANDEVTVIGAQQLQNVNVGYDLKNKVISLQSKDCTKT